MQAISPESTTKEGTYRDDMLVAMIRSHNLRLRGMQDWDIPNMSY